jgi:hypothetical protein
MGVVKKRTGTMSLTEKGKRMCVIRIFCGKHCFGLLQNGVTGPVLTDMVQILSGSLDTGFPCFYFQNTEGQNGWIPFTPEKILLHYRM